MTRLDAEGPLSSSVLLPPTRLPQTPPIRKASTLERWVSVGSLSSGAVFSKRGLKREQCFTLTQHLVHGRRPGPKPLLERENLCRWSPSQDRPLGLSVFSQETHKILCVLYGYKITGKSKLSFVIRARSKHIFSSFGHFPVHSQF